MFYLLFIQELIFVIHTESSSGNLGDILSQLTDEELLSEQPDPVLQNELRKIDRRHKIEIRYRHEQTTLWDIKKCRC